MRTIFNSTFKKAFNRLRLPKPINLPSLIGPSRTPIRRPFHTTSSFGYSLTNASPTVSAITRHHQTRKMASQIPHNKDASTLHFDPETTGVTPLPGISDQSRKTVIELLQKNHDENHIYFNEEGFHNHLVHEILAKYSLGATPELLRASYKNNVDYQRPLAKPDESIVSELRENQGSVEVWKKHLGVRLRYAEFLAFFKSEIERDGMEAIITKFLFAGTELSENILGRLLAGFVHPYIHLGYALEFKSAPIAAEALAQTCSHEDWIGRDYLFPAEEAAKKYAEENKGTEPASFLSLLYEVHNDETLRTSAQWSDSNKISGILSRHPQNILRIASKVHINPSALTHATAESINLALTLCAGSLRPDKLIAFDFFLMHSNNSSIFSTSINAQPWIPLAIKVRLLEWKVRYDLILYASRRAPKLYLDEVRNYTGTFSTSYFASLPPPSHPSKGRFNEIPVGNPWLPIIEEALKIKDDGHAIKMVRAIMHGEAVCRGLNLKTNPGEDWLHGGEMYRNYAGMVVDSAVRADGGHVWIRSTGFEEAWVGVPARGEGGDLRGAFGGGEV